MLVDDSERMVVMKKFNVEVKVNYYDAWDAVAVTDYIVGNNADEAIEIAKDWLMDQCSNAEDREAIEYYEYRAVEI